MRKGKFKRWLLEKWMECNEERESVRESPITFEEYWTTHKAWLTSKYRQERVEEND